MRRSEQRTRACTTHARTKERNHGPGGTTGAVIATPVSGRSGARRRRCGVRGGARSDRCFCGGRSGARAGGASMAWGGGGPTRPIPRVCPRRRHLPLLRKGAGARGLRNRVERCFAVARPARAGAASGVKARPRGLWRPLGALRVRRALETALLYRGTADRIIQTGFVQRLRIRSCSSTPSYLWRQQS